MSWSLLPEEVRLSIIRQLDRNDLKNLRQTCRSNSSSAASELFKTIHLRPSARSFNAARAVGASPILSEYVQAVVYHVDVVHDDYDNLKTFEGAVLSRLRRTYPQLDSQTLRADSAKAISLQYSRYREELDDYSSFDAGDQFDDLKGLCQRFPALRSVATTRYREDYQRTEDILQSMIDFLLLGPVSKKGLPFASFFEAVSDRPMSAIHAFTSLEEICLISKYTLRTAIFDILQELTIFVSSVDCLWGDKDWNSNLKNGIVALEAFLKATQDSQISTLGFGFWDFPYGTLKEEYHAFSQVFLKHHWPRLVNLKLDGVGAMEHEFEGFLAKHKTSLRSLHLADIEIYTDPLYLVSPEYDLRQSGSIFKLFEWIHDNLKLESARIRGMFSNCVDESWIVQASGDHSCIKRNIELWLTRKSSSPVPPDFSIPRHLKLLPESIGREWTDDSWKWADLHHYDADFGYIYVPWLLSSWASDS